MLSARKNFSISEPPIDAPDCALVGFIESVALKVLGSQRFPAVPSSRCTAASRRTNQ